MDEILLDSLGFGGPFNPPARGEMVEVRCCCDATKILGHVPYQGLVLRLLKMPSPSVDEAAGGPEIAEVRWHSWHKKGPYNRRWAYKSNDHPIEVIERIPGWVSA